MARIRTIKPEFPESESMGRISRDARLCFIMLWTISDDAGRLRGNSRMLASLLFPYDDDAKDLIDGWLTELEVEGCVTRYQVGKDTYVKIENWLEHQKIDKPSASKIPPIPEPVESAREDSRILPVGPRTKDQGSEDQRTKDQGEDQGAAAPAPAMVTLPEGFGISGRVRKWAAEKGHDRLDQHFDAFVGRARAKGYKYADWDEALMNAIRENWAKLPAQSKHDRHAGFGQRDYHEGANDF